MITNSTTTCSVCKQTYPTGESHSCGRTMGAAGSWTKCNKCQKEYPSNTEHVCIINVQK